MGRNEKVIIFLLLVFCTFSLEAQNRYVVFFPDKSNTEYSVDRPLEFLSQKALDRMLKSNFVISEEDFPVSQKYLDSLDKYTVPYFYTSRWLNAALVEVESSQMDLIKDKSFVSSFELVAPGARYSTTPSEENRTYTANDPATSIVSSDTQLNMLNADDMHADGFDGTGLWIAVFDAGFNGVNNSSAFGHLFQNNQLINTEDLVRGGKDVFLSDDHGTQALSCIAANYNDQVIGTGYGADISLYITEDARDEYKIEEYNWVIAAEKADSAGVDIISSSLGYDAFFDNASMNYKVSQLNGETAVITRGAEMASDRGILVVTSSGNELDLQVWDLISFPADGKNVLSVGSVKGDRTKSSFSLGGPTADRRIKPEVVAMGSSTTVIDDDGRITTSSGTSFSCPLIAGFAAGLWQANPDLTNVELRQLIMDASSQSNNPDNLLGYGIPNYNVAMGNILGLDEINRQQVEIYPNPLTDNLLKINFGQAVFYNELTINLYNSQGQLVVSKQERNILSDSMLELELPDLDKGIYILSFVGMENHKGIKLLKF